SDVCSSDLARRPARLARLRGSAGHRTRHPGRPAAAGLRSVLHDEAAWRGQRARALGVVRHHHRARRHVARREPTRRWRLLRHRIACGLTWGPRNGPQAPSVRHAPAKPWRASGLAEVVLPISRMKVARACAVVLALVFAAACARAGGPKVGAPSHHREGGFANTNPAIVRPGFWTRTTFFVSRVW